MVVSFTPRYYYVDPSVIYLPFSVAINSIYDLPIFPNYDPEGGPLTVVLSDTATVPVNYVIAGDNSKIIFYPLAFTEVGSHLITLALKDSQGD